MKKSIFCFLLALFCLSLTACASANPTPTPTDLPTAVTFSTATLPPTNTPAPVIPTTTPTLTPTQEPMTGTLTTQVNVRIRPNQQADSLGLMEFNTVADIVGKDSTQTWLLVIYPPNSGKRGWVAAQYIKLPDAGSLEKIREVADDVVEIAPDFTLEPTRTATPSPKMGKTTRQINVRTGPGSAFDSIALIEPNTNVVLTGHNQTNTWLQIEYPSGPNGFAWVATSYIETKVRLDELPLFDADGKLLQPGQAPAASGSAATATTIAPALDDVDSAEQPAVSMSFRPGGPRLVSYSSDLSTPLGDLIDWVEFTLITADQGQAAYLYFELDCTGKGGITVELRQGGRPVAEFPGMVCGQYDVAFKTLGGLPYLVKLSADGSAGELRYVQYTLSISTQP